MLGKWETSKNITSDMTRRKGGPGVGREEGKRGGGEEGKGKVSKSKFCLSTFLLMLKLILCMLIQNF